MLQLLGRRSSNNVQKIIWLLEELGVAYCQQDYGGRFGNTQTPEYLALNPHGTVPTLVDGSFSIWESNTILRYLAANYKSDVYPPNLQQRARVDGWMDWQVGTLSPEFRPLYIQLVRDGISLDEIGARASVARKLFQQLNHAVARQRYIAANEFTLADIAVGPMIYRWYKLGLGGPDTAHLYEYLKRLETRDAFAKHVMVELE